MIVKYKKRLTEMQTGRGLPSSSIGRNGKTIENKSFEKIFKKFINNFTKLSENSIFCRTFVFG